MPPEFLTLLSAKKGHFQLESGHHGNLWLNLDALVVQPKALLPFTNRLADLLAAHQFDAVCGPQLGGAIVARMVAERLGLESYPTQRRRSAKPRGLYAASYRLAPADRAKVHGRRIAVVDDAISAGSSVRATLAELRAHGAVPVAIGCLLQMGDAATRALADDGLPMEAVETMPYDVWIPSACPLCTAGVPLD